eukprot:1473332-Rhodomonas_salina.1
MRAPAAGDRRRVSRDMPLTVSVVTGTFQVVCTLTLASVTTSCTLVSHYAVATLKKHVGVRTQGSRVPGYPGTWIRTPRPVTL